MMINRTARYGHRNVLFGLLRAMKRRPLYYHRVSGYRKSDNLNRIWAVSLFAFVLFYPLLQIIQSLDNRLLSIEQLLNFIEVIPVCRVD